MENIKRLGFIGLGAMGRPMAENLLKAGYDLLVYAIRSEVAEALRDKAAELRSGASVTIASSVGDVAANSDALITILPEDAQIMQVYAGEGGVIDSAASGTVCIEMTSAMGSTLKDIAALAAKQNKRLSFLDAPVSGGVAGAENASLTIICGGERPLFEQCLPVLEAMGKKIFYAGELGSGKALKMVNQLLNAGNTLVAAEAVYLAKHLGLDMDLFMDIVRESSGNSWVFSNNVGKFMLPKCYEGGFRLELMKKDVGLSMDQIRKDRVSLPVSALIYQIYQAMENQGFGKMNYNVVGEWVDQQNKPAE